MIASALFRALSKSDGSGSAPGREASNTTERGQDKGTHTALGSVGCFCRGFLRFQHLALFGGNVSHPLKSLYSVDLLYIAGPRR